MVGFNIVSLRIFYANRAAKGMVRSFAGCVSDADRVIFCSRNRFSINNSLPIHLFPPIGMLSERFRFWRNKCGHHLLPVPCRPT